MFQSQQVQRRVWSILRWPDLISDMVKQYRKLDDQIITRLNRANAQLRDQSRRTPAADAQAGVDGMCLRLWEEMMGELNSCLTRV